MRLSSGNTNTLACMCWLLPAATHVVPHDKGSAGREFASGVSTEHNIRFSVLATGSWRAATLGLSFSSRPLSGVRCLRGVREFVKQRESCYSED